MVDRILQAVVLYVYLIAAAACGGSGSGSSVQPPVVDPPLPPAVPSFIDLSSDAGDYIGQGLDYSYSKADSVLTVTATDAHLSISVDGDEGWTGEFQLPDTLTRLEPGTYDNLTRYPFHDAAVGGLSWYGEGRGCNTLTGSINIDTVTYDGSDLTDIDLRFEQNCEGGVPALRGEIHWDTDDTTVPPGPVEPPPAGLWAPVDGVTPVTGNYVYLESQPGDFIGGGAIGLYTDADSTITLNTNEGLLSVGVNGPDNWNGDFRTMNVISQFEAGYYGDLQRYPFDNPAKGGLNWSGNGRGCNTLTGWFVVDSVTYDGASLTAIDLRFEQHCEGNSPALNVEIHWTQ